MDNAQTVNPQITDAVNQSNVKVVAEAPAMAMANVYQSLAHSIGLSMENAVNQQQQSNVLSQAVTTQCVQTILSSGDGGSNK